MPRRTHTRTTRKVVGGIPWRGRHRLDHRLVPDVLQKMIEDDDDATAGGGGAVRRSPSRSTDTKPADA